MKCYGNPKTRIFHGLGCRYYKESNCNVVFSSRNEATEAGYDPCGHCRPGDILPEGRYHLEIEYAEVEVVDTSNFGYPSIYVELSAAKYPGAYPVSHYVPFVLENNPKDKNKASLRMAKTFFKTFNLRFKLDRFNPIDFNPDELIGATGNVRVKVIDIDGELVNQLVLRD